ncbi:glucose 1-dehydrogenase [Nitrosopumilus sp.]|uniref:glucose 1-dehydrogenase n=1 Tax=Nitrosopumilus sp. TaxID=2024843 RepID=UPI003D0DA0F1
MSYLDSLFSLNEKIAIVTGAARGNGKAISHALLKSGATVILVDVLKNQLISTAKAFQKNNLKAFHYHCDITKKSQILKLRQYVEKNFGRINILINNAGVSFSHPTISYPEKSWEKTYAVNLKAPFVLSQEFAKIMKRKKNNGGVIINITSLNAELAFPNNPAYQAFKGGLKQLTKSLALDFANYGIRVNSIGPGYFRTNMTEKSWLDSKKQKERTNQTILKRWGTPNDLSGVVVFLSSDASSYITGQDIYVDGGWLVKGIS